jgi:SAM-dependent methyltransferase
MTVIEHRYGEWRAFKYEAPRPVFIKISPFWREDLPRHVGESGKVLKAALSDARSVLDVGASDRIYERVFAGLGLEALYKSVDTDKSYKHDYEDFLSVDESVDAIVMFEIIEHLPLDVGIDFLAHARRLLNPHGVLIVSTPNAAHANQVWKADFTHVRPWPWADLYGALRLVGFDDVQLYRQFFGSWKRRLALPLYAPLYRLLELDPAQTTLAVARI